MSDGKEINLHQMFKDETGGNIDRDFSVYDRHGVHCESIVIWDDVYVKWLQNKLKEQLLKLEK